ncbi:MAG: TonB-dependent receptor plug domain-containing protein, partial [Brachymonas sp.]|nr:TonB-dependent receptor plug domain-containing protein [Brachymonas sp.]
MNQKMSLPLKVLAAAYACTWVATPLFAQTTTGQATATDDNKTLAPVVVTASQREQAAREAPASISVITREEITAKPHASVRELLGSIEGVSVTGSSPNDQDISIRGMPGEYTLILVDGKRQKTRETMNRGTGGVQTEWVPPLSAIERIEVVRGPMSSLYGADAMGGVINIITRKVPRAWSGEMGVGGVVQQEKNQGHTRKMDFWIGGPLQEDVLGLQISGSVLRRSEDHIHYPANGTSGAHGKETSGLNVKLAARPAPNQDVIVTAGREQLNYLATPGRSAPPLTPR